MREEVLTGRSSKIKNGADCENPNFLMIPSLTAPDFADYDSGEPHRGLVTRLSPTMSFYGRITTIVFKSAARAKRGNFSDEDWYAASLIVRDAFERSGARVAVRGTGHLARLEGPCVLIGNHMSTAETFLLASMILPFKKVTFVVKRSLVEYPIFKHIMRSRDPIVVGRVNPREDLKAVLGGGKERLEAGTSVVIFPQKTRKVTFDREGFNTIGVKLASRAGVPVVPLALKTNAWSNGKWFKDYGRFLPDEEVHFEFGEPIPPGGNDRETQEQVVAYICEKLLSWGVPVK